MYSTVRSSMSFLAIAALFSSGCGSNPVEPAPGVPESAVPVTKAAARPAGTVQERIDQAKKALEAGDVEAAIVVLDEAVLIEPVNRNLLAMLIRAYTAGAQAAKQADPAKFYRYNVTCGGYMRELRDKFTDLKAEEKALIMETLRNEAAAHARSKRVEETSGSLRELKAAGFADFESLRKDPDYAEIFAFPAFPKIFDEIAAGQ